MTRRAVPTPTCYELRIDGHLDDRWSTWFEGMSLARVGGTTTLRGPVADQAELHGVIGKVRDIGADLVSLRTMEPTEQATTGSALDRIDWPVRTERLTLRRVTAGDAEATWPYRRLPEVYRWLTQAQTSLEDYRRYFEEPERLAKTLVIELDGQVIGDLMLKLEDAWAQAEVSEQARASQAELGWVLHPAHAGQGYATEAVRELIRVCFEDLGVHRVTAYCFAENTASWRVMERVGMRREAHTLRDGLHRSGEWMDGMAYALLADEWAGSA